MLKFNNDNIFTGFIKQYLTEFNLPMCHVYTKQNRKYFIANHKESPEIIKSIIDDKYIDKDWPSNLRYIPYIKDGEIQIYVNKIEGEGEEAVDKSYWKELSHYFYDKKIVNKTKNLKIKNNIYDSYTHEYLGDYLRFLRDYKDIDLMPLYNCFSNKICQNISVSILNENDKILSKFKSSDTNYKIYMFPVKLNKEYTIAIDCKSNIEICCGIYGKYLDLGLLRTEDIEELSKSKKRKYREFGEIMRDTYSSMCDTRFNQPFLYTKLKNLNEYLAVESVAELANREADLKMFIKVPANNKSSITVLEGDYHTWNDKIVKINNTKLEVYKNHTVINFGDWDPIFKKSKDGILPPSRFEEERDFKPITELQLLRYNTGESYPFADRLIEYLVGNVITSWDPIGDNIQRVQQVVEKRTEGEIADYDDAGNLSGVWDPRLRAVLYSYMQNPTYAKTLEIEGKQYVNDSILRNNKTMLEKNHDILGYVDKDVENMYRYRDTKVNYSISTVDIYPDLYREESD